MEKLYTEKMAVRNWSSQNLHDNVIQAAYNSLDKIGHDVYTNPNQQRITNVSGYYPDIIMTARNDKYVKWVIEVETYDTITQNEAINQWRTFATLGGQFYLLVPIGSLHLARNICIQNYIKARFGYYEVNAFGHIQITWE